MYSKRIKWTTIDESNIKWNYDYVFNMINLEGNNLTFEDGEKVGMLIYDKIGERDSILNVNLKKADLNSSFINGLINILNHNPFYIHHSTCFGKFDGEHGLYYNENINKYINKYDEFMNNRNNEIKDLRNLLNLMELDNQKIKISEDFSVSPCTRDDAVRFRDDILLPRLVKACNIKKKLTIDFDDCFGYSTVFLREVFGGLVEIYRYKKETILQNIIFISRDNERLVEYINKYLDEAEKEIKKQR